MNDDNPFSNLPSAPGRRLKPPLWYRLRKSAGYLRHNGRVHFIVIFALFVLLGALMELTLEGARADGPFHDFFDALWFTVVTITTVGYGDISPTAPSAQVWAMFEMIVGIGLVGIITGSVASILVERNRKRALGLVPLRHLEKHIVICGWKKDMRMILLGILAADPWLSSLDLVLVTSHPPGEVGELRRDHELRGLHFVIGSHTDPNVLEMAQVSKASRVIILADPTGNVAKDDADSRTVLAATTIETLNNVVYTCTELIQPHFTRYLGPAGVEEVVLSEENGTALLVAASLGDGLSNLAACFFPDMQEQLQVMEFPTPLIGAPYEELAAHFEQQGLLLIGLLEHTGNLHDRKREMISDAMRQPTYQQAVQRLQQAARLVSNVPRLAPPADIPVLENTKAIVLLPALHRQSEQERERRASQQPQAHPARNEHLMICGWKAELADLLEKILQAHAAQGRPLSRLTVAARLPEAEAAAVRARRSLRKVTLVDAEPTDPNTLSQAEVQTAHRVLVLTDPQAERHSREVDAKNVMITFALNETNPAAYKCVEISNPNFGEHLRIANVEETIYTQRYQRMMLVQAALGTGFATAIGALFEPFSQRLRVVAFEGLEAGATFADYAAWFEQRGQQLVGVIDHSGNHHARRRDYLYQAQSQPRIENAINRLQSLKTVHSNDALLNPGPGYRPGRHSRAIVITRSSPSPASS